MFDIINAKSDDGFSPIPNGWYSAFVDKAEWRTSKSGSEYLNLTFKLFGEQYENRLVFCMYNLLHPKDQVRNIALGQIQSLMLGSGFEVKNYNTKEELVAVLLECSCQIKLAIQSSEEYGDKNIVKGYRLLPENQKAVSKDEIVF